MSVRHEITTEGIVIGRFSAGEGSVRVQMYTEALGLISALAKSGREERSKLRPHLQAGTHGTYTCIKGERDWRLLGAIGTHNYYFALAGRPAAQTAAARVVSVVRQLVHGEEVDARLYRALAGFLSALPSLADTEVRVAERLAVARILFSLGYVEGKAVPHLSGETYAPAPLKELVPFQHQLTVIINEGLSASGLS